MNVGLNHLEDEYQGLKDHAKIYKIPRVRQFVNQTIYIVGGLGVLVVLPQAYNIWVDGNIAGVSLITWVGFFVAALFWCLYGAIHRQKPIFLTNFIVMLLDGIIIAGVLSRQLGILS